MANGQTEAKKIPVKSFGPRYFPVFLSLAFLIFIFAGGSLIGYKSNLIKEITPKSETGENYRLNKLKEFCESKGGDWILGINECENNPDGRGIAESECKSMSGNFLNCASPCRNDPEYPEIGCIEMCTQVCQF